jgi:hypothetical protein
VDCRRSVQTRDPGVYGSDLFAGYYGVDRHNYQHMLLYPLLQAAVFKGAGVGVLQMRLLPVLFGLALLLIVFLAGKELGDRRVGVLAVVLLLGLRVWTGSDATGILLLDRARVNRYDIAVPVFGLLALWAYVNSRSKRLTRSFRLCCDRIRRPWSVWPVCPDWASIPRTRSLPKWAPPLGRLPRRSNSRPGSVRAR